MIYKNEFRIPIYDQDVYMLLGDPYEVKLYLSDAFGGEFEFNPNETVGVCFYRASKHWIWFNSEKITVPLIVHEIGHATFDIMLFLGLEISDQEAFCYLQEYLMTKCVDLFAIQMDPIKLQSPQEDDQV